LSLQYANELLQLGQAAKAKQILLKTAAHSYPNYYQLLVLCSVLMACQFFMQC